MNMNIKENEAAKIIELWDEILISPLFDKLYLEAPHHIEYGKTNKRGKYFDRIHTLLLKIQNEATTESVKDWINSLIKDFNTIKKSKNKDFCGFLQKLNFLCTSIPETNVLDTKTKIDFSRKIGELASFGKYKEGDSYFKILVVDDYFIFSIPIFVEAVRMVTGENSKVPLIHFDFECIPENAIKRCKETQYDLILLDIDFGLLDLVESESNTVTQKSDREAFKVARFANNQKDFKVPIVLFSKYEDIHYYEGLLGNVIGKIVKGDIRPKIVNNILNKKYEVSENLVLPLIDYLLDYYKIKVYKNNKDLTFRATTQSSIYRSGIYVTIEGFSLYSKLPKDSDKINKNILKHIISIKTEEENETQQKSKTKNGNKIKRPSEIKVQYEDCAVIPFLYSDKYFGLHIIARLPEFNSESQTNNPSSYNSALDKRLTIYINDVGKIVNHDILNITKGNEKLHFEIITKKFNKVFNERKWNGTDVTNLVTALERDLRYITVSVFNKMSLLDVVGPIMIGPSSSHTAGANRIARIARNFATLLIPDLQKIEVQMLNSFGSTGVGHGSNKAIAAGLLGLSQYSTLLPDVLGNADKIRCKKDFRDHDNKKIPGISDKSGCINIDGKEVKVEFNWEMPLDTEIHNSSLRFVYDCGGNKKYEMTARSWGGGNIQISSIKSNGQPIRVFINSWENFFKTDEELDELKDKLNGKVDVNVKFSDNVERKIIKIYEDPDKEIENAIKQVMSNFTYKPAPEVPKFNIPKKIQRPVFLSLDDLIEQKYPLHEIAIQYEKWYWGGKYGPEFIWNLFYNYFFLLKKVAESSVTGDLRINSKTGYALSYAHVLHEEAKKEYELRSLSNSAMIYAIGVNEVNVKMAGPILAAPTAGSCGVVPGVLMALNEYLSREKYFTESVRDNLLIEGLLVSALVGLVITNTIPPAGATHGCQAEIGTAGAMGAAMATYVISRSKGKPIDEINTKTIKSTALSLDNYLGIICDPLGGKVEYPCIQRAGDKAAECISIAFKSIAGVETIITPSDIIRVMKKVGEDMSVIYKETSRGPYAQSQCSCYFCPLKEEEK